MKTVLVNIENLKLKYDSFQLTINQFAVHDGERLLIQGKSGSGKSTFLKLICGLATADSGQISLESINITELNQDKLKKIRLQKISYIPHDTELIHSLSLLDNILLPLSLNPAVKITDSLKQQAMDLIAETGLEHLVKHQVKTLSKGEKQRLGICRALIKSPELILADEPFSNLDENNKSIVQDLIFTYQKEHKSTLILVSHNKSIAGLFDRTIHFPFVEES